MVGTIFSAAPGKAARVSTLETSKGRGFAEFLKNSGAAAYASLVELRRVKEPKCADVIVFDVQVERPQKIIHSILRVERIAVFFFDADDTYPEVLALRSDFPSVPHTNYRDTEFPRSLCLYDQPFENVKLDWTPARFLGRIRYWLQKTATGTLHGDDQPLEPLLFDSPERLILPGDYSLTELQNQARLFEVFPAAVREDETTLVARRSKSGPNTKIEFLATIFSCQEQTHGVIQYHPQNLEQLHDFCEKAGLNLGRCLGERIKAWQLDKPTKNVLECKLIIILLLPKRRHDGGVAEAVEKWAFLTLKNIEEVGVELDVVGRGGGSRGYILGAPAFQKTNLANVPIGTLQVLHGLSPSRAAAMNGAIEVTAPILGIGMGALGSQVFNNLMRSGFGRWTLIDPDTLLPHNCARHFLGEWAVGQNKAEAMAHVANAVLDSPEGETLVKALPADFLKPRRLSAAVEAAYAGAEAVLDFSASVAVARHCSSTDVKARHIAAFLAPSGKSLVVTAEDAERKVRLDWLEIIHYRAVLQEPSLARSLQPPDSRFRYGNSCRDVSLQLAQDDTAMWSGIASKTMRQLFQRKDAVVRVFATDSRGAVSVFEPSVSPLLEIAFETWTVRFDELLLDKLSNSRGKKLPNETGGILLGHFDTERRICSVADILESPPDSQEWPTSYIRGCVGLQEKVREAEIATIDQITYVGEWHSHPEGAAVIPSGDDCKAYAWLAAQMTTESLPGIMLIIGDGKRFCLVTSSSPALRKGSRLTNRQSPHSHRNRAKLTRSSD